MQQLQQAQSTNLGRGCIIVFAVFWLLFSCMFTIIPIVPALLTVSSGDYSGLLTFGLFSLCSLPFVAVGIGLLVFALRPIVAGTRLSKPEIGVSTTTPRVGDDFAFTYFQTFSRATDVEQIRFTLVFRETARYHRGTNTYTVTENKVVQEFEYPARRYETGEAINVRRDLQIPADAMHTFLGTNNKLQWFVRPEIKMKAWPDFSEEYEITVIPEVRQ